MTTPDTRPRCGGSPGKPELVCDHAHTNPDSDWGCYCSGCADCDQTTTTRGDSDELRGVRVTADHWHETDRLSVQRAEAAEQRLREVESENKTLKRLVTAFVRTASAPSFPGGVRDTFIATWREALPVAQAYEVASRPAPDVPAQEETR